MENIIKSDMLDKPLPLALFLAAAHSVILYITVGFIVFLDGLFGLLDAADAATVFGYVARVVALIAMFRFALYVFKLRAMENGVRLVRLWVLVYILLMVILFPLFNNIEIPYLLIPFSVSFLSFLIALKREKI